MPYTRVPGQYCDVKSVSRQIGFPYQAEDVCTLTNGTPGGTDYVTLTTLSDVEKYWVGAPVELAAYVGYSARQRFTVTGVDYSNGSIQLSGLSSGNSSGNSSTSLKILSFFTNKPLERVGLTYIDINDYIRQAEDWVDDKIHHSYLDEGRQSVDEKKGLNVWKTIPYPNMPRRLMHYPTEYYYIALDHTNLKTFDPEQGDSLRVFDGSQWVEWLGSKTEGVNDLSNADFWVDYVHGYIFFITTIPAPMDTSVKVTYRFGGNMQFPDTVPETIKYIAVRKAAINILESERVASLLPGGKVGGAIGIPEAIALWYREIYEAIALYRKTFVWSQPQI